MIEEYALTDDILTQVCSYVKEENLTECAKGTAIWIWRCMYRASSYNKSMNRQDSQNFVYLVDS